MKWTKNKPTKPGWYWVMRVPRYKPHIRLFERVPAKFRMDGDYPIEPETGPLSTAGWEWFAGPIPSPKLSS